MVALLFGDRARVLEKDSRDRMPAASWWHLLSLLLHTGKGMCLSKHVPSSMCIAVHCALQQASFPASTGHRHTQSGQIKELADRPSPIRAADW